MNCEFVNTIMMHTKTFNKLLNLRYITSSINQQIEEYAKTRLNIQSLHTNSINLYIRDYLYTSKDDDMNFIYYFEPNYRILKDVMHIQAFNAKAQMVINLYNYIDESILTDIEECIIVGCLLSRLLERVTCKNDLIMINKVYKFFKPIIERSDFLSKCRYITPNTRFKSKCAQDWYYKNLYYHIDLDSDYDSDMIIDDKVYDYELTHTSSGYRIVCVTQQVDENNENMDEASDIE